MRPPALRGERQSGPLKHPRRGTPEFFVFGGEPSRLAKIAAVVEAHVAVDALLVFAVFGGHAVHDVYLHLLRPLFVAAGTALGAIRSWITAR